MAAEIIKLKSAPLSPALIGPTATRKQNADRAWLSSVLLLFVLCGLAALLGSGRITIESFFVAYPVEIVAILIALDLLSRFIASTGVLISLSLSLASLTGGRLDKLAIVAGVFMFVVSATLNNLAATFVLAGVFLSVLKDLEANPGITRATLAMLLCITNLGGAATPIGDFPAIILMTSGAVDFLAYLVNAAPLFATTALIAANAYGFFIRRIDPASKDQVERARSAVALNLLLLRNEGRTTNWLAASIMSVIFLGMVFAWAMMDPEVWPFHMTAIIGTALVAIAAGPTAAKKAISTYDLSTVIFLMIVLTVAAMVAATDWLVVLAECLKHAFPNPVLLLVAVMVVTAMASGLVSAGPAAAAMLPLVIELAKGPLSGYGAWPATAFAAAICAGSSLFLTSATSGPALTGEVRRAGVAHITGDWGFSQYVRYGLLNFVFQLAIALIWVLVAVSDLFSDTARIFAALAIPLGLASFTIGRLLTDLRSASIPDDERAQSTPKMQLPRVLKTGGLASIIAALVWITLSGIY